MAAAPHTRHPYSITFFLKRPPRDLADVPKGPLDLYVASRPPHGLGSPVRGHLGHALHSTNRLRHMCARSSASRTYARASTPTYLNLIPVVRTILSLEDTRELPPTRVLAGVQRHRPKTQSHSRCAAHHPQPRGHTRASTPTREPPAAANRQFIRPLTSDMRLHTPPCSTQAPSS